MKLWKLNKRSSTLADMSMNRILLSELIVKGALVGIIAYLVVPVSLKLKGKCSVYST